ncbi:MAG: hypothetical protein AB2558_11875 [Candidatus Thiodiazotropha sp.]
MSDKLKKKILTLSERAWERKLSWPEVTSWLSNFNGEVEDQETETLHALYLLSQSMYFGQGLIREMLKSIYSHLYRYPIIEDIRKNNNDTLDPKFIEREFKKELYATRFLGVGNPSESGPHLLYYFRQINNLSKFLFIDSAEILEIDRNDDVVKIKQRNPHIRRYVFLDDVLGSGTQVAKYLTDILREINYITPKSKVFYYSLFATTEGLNAARSEHLFDGNVECIYELDESFKCFSNESRYFTNLEGGIKRDVAYNVAHGYGSKLWPRHPLGYKDGELLLALYHNTPNNCLPLIWAEGNQRNPWIPIFKRFHKKYN